MTGLVINCIIGSGIFGVTAELIRLLGPASPIAVVIAALMMAIIMACVAEVASSFTEPGGAYLYVRTAFGRFAGLQVGWFWLLATVGGGAAASVLDADYLGEFLPWAAHGWVRALLIATLITVPAAVNYAGVRSGANLSNALVVAKLLPIGLVIALGLPRLAHPTQVIGITRLAASPWEAWLSALLLMLFCYSGYEDALVPLGEVKNPRRTVPFALAGGLLVSTLVYTFMQAVIVATVRSPVSERPLAEAATLLMGSGSLFVKVAVIVSAYGLISASLLNAPRLACAFAAHGDSPTFLGRLHPRFHTPGAAIVGCALVMWALAATGSFLLVVALAAGSTMVVYGGVCAALLRLRSTRQTVPGLRIPLGRALAVAGIVISALLLTRLEAREAVLMTVTALVATVNWWWSRRRARAAFGRPM